MSRRHVIVAVVVIAGIYGAYWGISSLFRTDEGEIRRIIDAFTRAFAGGNLRTIQSYLTEDFEVTWRSRRMTRKEMSDILRYTFIRGERIRLAGKVDRIEIKEDRAFVLWNGKIRMSGNSSRFIGEGTGNLDFRKINGEWLLASAEAEL